MVTADATISKQIQTRIQKASAAFSKLFQRVWSRNTLSLKTKVSVYKTMILPILTQDCETWNAKQSHYRKLEGCQNKFLRTICNKKWEHFVAYSELFDILARPEKNTAPISENSCQKKNWIPSIKFYAWIIQDK